MAMAADTHYFGVALEGEPKAVLRVLRATLKRLGRDYGVRCWLAERLGPDGAMPIKKTRHIATGSEL